MIAPRPGFKHLENQMIPWWQVREYIQETEEYIEQLKKMLGEKDQYDNRGENKSSTD